MSCALRSGLTGFGVGRQETTLFSSSMSLAAVQQSQLKCVIALVAAMTRQSKKVAESAT